MVLALDLTDKLARFPIAYSWQPVRGWPVKHFDTILSQNSQRTKQHALGEGPWDACEKLWADAFSIPEEDFVFHPGTGNDTPDSNFPFDPPHPWTAYISAKCPSGLSDDQTDKLFGIYRTLRTGNFNGAGQQLNGAGAIVTPSDFRDEFFFKPNPANVAVDQLLRWGKRLNDIVNWPAWVDWRDFNDELIQRDDASYTPRSISLTPTSGGVLVPGTTYYIRVSAMKGADESSASLKTLETKANSITLLGGQNAFQVNWLIKGDEKNPVDNPEGITGYRIYIGTVDGTWIGYFTVSDPALRVFMVTTTGGTTGGEPLDIATSGLLTEINRFECGLFFIPPYDLATALDRICQISCADWQWSGFGTNTYRNDKVRFMSPANRAPIFTLNMAETGMGSFKTYPVDRRNRPNQIVVNFRDRDDEFLGPAQPVILDREQLQIDDKQVNSFTIDGGTMYRSQAQRCASFYARVLCDMDQMLEMIASPKSYHVLPGDVVNVTNETPDWEDIQFVVRRKKENVETSLGDQITAQIYAPNLYSDTDHSPIAKPLPAIEIDPFENPPLATDLVLSLWTRYSPTFAYLAGIRGTFSFQNFPMGRQQARVFIKGPSETEPDDSTYREVDSGIFSDESNVGSFETPPLALGKYWIKVQTESVLGITSGTGLVDDIVVRIPLELPQLPIFVRSIFQGVFGRPVSEEEYAEWINSIGILQTIGDVQTEIGNRIEDLFLSPEYIARGRTDSQFIDDCYYVYLGGNPDVPGHTFWLDDITDLQGSPLFLTNDEARAEIRFAFISSFEFENRINALKLYSAGDASAPLLGAAPSITKFDASSIWNITWPYPIRNGVDITNVRIQIRKASDTSVIWNDLMLGVMTSKSFPQSSYDCKVRYAWRNNFRGGGSDGWSDWSLESDAFGTGSGTPNVNTGESDPVENDPTDSRRRFNEFDLELP